MKIDRIEFLCDQALFKGKIFMPDDLSTCKGAIIFVHGLGYCTKSYDVDGAFFAENGYLLLTYNLRGHAATPGEWTLNYSVEDLRLGIDYLLRNYRFENVTNLGVLGHSTGALIALLAAIQDSRIKFGSIVTVVTSLDASYRYWFQSGYNRDVKAFFKLHGEISPFIDKALDHFEMYNDFKANKFSRESLEFPYRYGMLKAGNFHQFWSEIAYSPDILTLTDKIRIPLILFRGESDEVMPPTKTDELYRKLKVMPKKLVLTKSKNHFQNDSWRLIQEQSIQFFDELLRKKEKEAVKVGTGGAEEGSPAL